MRLNLRGNNRSFTARQYNSVTVASGKLSCTKLAHEMLLFDKKKMFIFLLKRFAKLNVI